MHEMVPVTLAQQIVALFRASGATQVEQMASLNIAKELVGFTGASWGCQALGPSAEELRALEPPRSA